uniref:Uncharacterized protein n=1 Tax=Eutreptiella gymnastica TaxID=73025 RepID=A0A7S4FVA0_9EUGL
MCRTRLLTPWATSLGSQCTTAVQHSVAQNPVALWHNSHIGGGDHPATITGWGRLHAKLPSTNGGVDTIGAESDSGCATPKPKAFWNTLTVGCGTPTPTTVIVFPFSNEPTTFPNTPAPPTQ